MKLFRNYTEKTARAAIIISLSTALTSIAQTRSDEKPDTSSPARRQFNRPEGARGFPGAIAPFAAGFERIYNVLTEEQRASLRDAMQSQREKLRDAEEKLRDARRQIFEAALLDKFDEAAVRDKATAAAKLEAEMMVVRAKAFSQMRPPLSAEQLEKLKNLSSTGSEIQTDRARRRPEVPRDENGLPPKDRVPAEPKSN